MNGVCTTFGSKLETYDYIHLYLKTVDGANWRVRKIYKERYRPRSNSELNLISFILFLL